MNQSFNVSQLSVHRSYTSDVVELNLTDIAKRFVFILDREGVDSNIETLFKTLPNRKLSYRGFPYTEQIQTALKDPESTGLLIVLSKGIETFTDRHFHEHGNAYQELSRKYKKPIILHMVSESGKCDVLETYSDVMLQRQDIYGLTHVECVKNRLMELIRPS